MDEILHNPRNPGMIRFPCTYQQSYGFLWFHFVVRTDVIHLHVARKPLGSQRRPGRGIPTPAPRPMPLARLDGDGDFFFCFVSPRTRMGFQLRSADHFDQRLSLRLLRTCGFNRQGISWNDPEGKKPSNWCEATWRRGSGAKVASKGQADACDRPAEWCFRTSIWLSPQEKKQQKQLYVQ